MKKIIYIFISVLLIVSVFSGCKAKTNTGDVTVNGIGSNSSSDMSCFETYDNVKIVALTEKGLKEKNLVIPEVFETAEYNIFYNNDDFSNDTLESISFENPDFNLPDDFFYQCHKLRSVELPSNITKIPYNTFYYCRSLEKVKLPVNVETIGENAFYECSGLKEIAFNDKLNVIEDGAFRHTALKDITLPNSLTTIGESVFADIPTLESVVIPESVTSIAHNAFYYSDSDYGERGKPQIKVVEGSWADIHFDEYTDGGLYAEKVTY